jgi:Fe-S-cluster containining protein
MNCENCGACCRWLFFSFPNPSREDIIFLLARGACKIFGNRWAIPSICPKLENGKCTIYEKRPSACRSFIVGGSDCMACRKIEGL